MIDRLFTAIARLLGMCGEGREFNIWARIADYWFVDCACCLFWRGVMLGCGCLALALGAATCAYQGTTWMLESQPPARVAGRTVAMTPAAIGLRLESALDDITEMQADLLVMRTAIQTTDHRLTDIEADMAHRASADAVAALAERIARLERPTATPIRKLK